MCKKDIRYRNPMELVGVMDVRVRRPEIQVAREKTQPGQHEKVHGKPANPMQRI